MEPSTRSDARAQAATSRTVAIAVTAAMGGWLAAAACAALVSSAGDTILAVGTGVFDASWVVCALCAAPFTPVRLTVVGEIARDALHLPHLLALGGLGTAEALTGHGDPVRIAGWLLCAAAIVNLGLDLRRERPATPNSLASVPRTAVAASPAVRARREVRPSARAEKRRVVRIRFHFDIEFRADRGGHTR